MNGCRAASAHHRHRRRAVAAGAAAAVLVALGPGRPGIPPAVTVVEASPTRWIAPQPNPGAVGLGPAASQLSRDGSVVDFVTTWAGIDPEDVHLDADVFEHVVATGQPHRINLTPGTVTYGNGWLDSLSADGSVVSLTTAAALLPDDTNDRSDVYVLDRRADRLQRASVDSQGGQSSDVSGPSAVSADGRFVAFSGSLSTEPGRAGPQVWLRDLQTGQIEQVGVTSAGDQADARADLGSMSDDGRYVSFWSPAGNLPGGGGRDPRGRDFYIRDRATGTTTHGIPGAGVPETAVMSGDGNVVAYASDSSFPRLAHVWDRATGIDRVVRIA